MSTSSFTFGLDMESDGRSVPSTRASSIHSLDGLPALANLSSSESEPSLASVPASAYTEVDDDAPSSPNSPSDPNHRPSRLRSLSSFVRDRLRRLSQSPRNTPSEPSASSRPSSPGSGRFSPSPSMQSSSSSSSDDAPRPSKPRIGILAKPRVSVTSAARRALEGAASAPTGLLKFWKKATEEDIQRQRAHADEYFNNLQDTLDDANAKIAAHRQAEAREKAAERKRRSRAKKREAEIEAGMRSPGGRKLKRELESDDEVSSEQPEKHYQNLPSLKPQAINDVLISERTTKRRRSDVAENSRPERVTLERLRMEKRKPQGRKRKTEKTSAAYVNWHGAFLWDPIDDARRIVGWNATDIVNYLRRTRGGVYEYLSRTTVNGWIVTDSNGSKGWSQSCLTMNEHGNHPGETNQGGRRGILVSCVMSFVLLENHRVLPG